MKKYIYLSGPISGLTYDEARYGWRKQFTDWLTEDVTVLSPMRHEGHLAELKSKITDATLNSAHFFSSPKMIVAKDFLDIDQSSLMVVNLHGAKLISKGTLAEVGYAYAKGKPIITIMEPSGNPNDGPFLRELSDVVIDNMPDAALIVNSLLSEGV